MRGWAPSGRQTRRWRSDRLRHAGFAPDVTEGRNCGRIIGTASPCAQKCRKSRNLLSFGRFHNTVCIGWGSLRIITVFHQFARFGLPCLPGRLLPFLQGIFHGKHRTSTQARTPSRRSKRSQLGTALASAHRYQDRPQGRGWWRQGSCSCCIQDRSKHDRQHR